MKNCEFKLKKEKFLLILILTVALILIPCLKASNQRNIRSSTDEKNNDEKTIPQYPIESSVNYSDTSGKALGVFVSGDYAYIADNNSGLAVIDISDPTNPGAPIYEDTSGYAYDVYVSGDYAYVANAGSGLVVIDISDPTNPGTPIYEDTVGLAMAIYVSGDDVYVADFNSGLAVIDISNPTNPGMPVYEATTGYAYDIYVSGDYAYLANGLSGLAIINISDPTNPGTPVYEDTSGTAYGVFVSGDYAYVADGLSGLAIINISDPTNPRTPVYEDTSGTAFEVYICGDYAYVANAGSGLVIIDISDPTNPGAPIYEDTVGLAMAIYVSGDYAYVADFNAGLAVIHISEPIIPETPVYRNTSGDSYDIYISGDYAYVANGLSGLAIIDISDPTNPGWPVYKNTGLQALGVYVSGDYAYMGVRTGFAIIDISDPTNPGTPIYVNTTGWAERVYISGNYAYVTTVAGLAIIDITDPKNPEVVFDEVLAGITMDIYVSGDYAYVANYLNGLAIIDISDPSNPGTPVYEAITDYAWGVYVSGDYAYVAVGGLAFSGLAVIDISDPTNPGTPVYRGTTGGAYNVYVSGDYAYVCQTGGLAVIDISDPTNPAIYGETPGYAYDVYISGDYAYAAAHAWGLAVYQVRRRIQTVAPILTNVMSDFSVEFGYTGVNISWTAIDSYPNTYTIELQGTGIAAGPTMWSSGLAITYNIPDGLGVGEYIYTVNFTDDYDLFTTHTVTMTVQDTTDPIITSSPGDFIVEYGYTGILISWTATDPHPQNYTIELQGSGIVVGPTAWSSGVAIIYNIPDGLTVGEYIYTVNFTDAFDNFATHTVTMTVQDTTDPIITDSPGDFIVEYGYTGINISWTATDSHPYTYKIELQDFGVVAGPISWFNNTPIIYNIPDGLNVGEYIYTINFTDDNDNFITDSVTMTVEDTTDPILIDIPSDFSVEYGYTEVSISWTATDSHPYTYIIELQGLGIVAGPSEWSNGIAITYNVPDGFAVGEYIYTVNFTDVYDHFATHTVIMTVQDTIDPLITNSLDDFTIEVGYTGVNISWTVTDPHPNTYTIELQGVGIVAGPSAWSSGESIIYNIPDGLAIGEYNYIVNFTDDYGNFITHTITMTVEEVPSDDGGAIPLGNYYLTFLIIGMISLALVQKRRMSRRI